RHPVGERRSRRANRDPLVSATLRSTADLIAAEDAHTSGLYTKRGIVLVRGDGAMVFDSEGRTYIDCVGGQGTANLGHGNAAVADAVAQQARVLASCTELFYNDRRAELYEVLAEILPKDLDRFFLCNSGTEAVEGALKFARAATKRTAIVATMRGFHGKTMGALSATWGPEYRDLFGPLVPGFSHVPYNKPAAIDAIGEILRLDLARNARERGAELQAGLRAMASGRVREVRGLGLLVGVELKENAATALRALQDEGVLALGAGPTVVRFLPPLVITADEIERVLAASRKALA